MTSNTDTGAIRATATAPSTSTPSAPSSAPLAGEAALPLTTDPIVRYVLDGGSELFLADDPHIRVVADDGFRVMRIASTDFRGFLRRSYSRAQGTRPPLRALKEAQEELCDIAIEQGVRRELYVRIARFPDRTYLDLCNDGRQILEMSARGTSVIQESDCPAAFLRSRDMLPLPLPIAGGTLDDLRPFVLVLDEDQLRTVALWAVGVLCLAAPMPFLFISGEEGSAKTSSARALVKILDPRLVPICALTGDRENTMVQATQNAILAFDNISSFDRKQADFLCSVVTGVGMVRRKRYTDHEVSRLYARRPVVATGINCPIEHSDLLSRTLSVESPRLEDRHCRPELVLDAELAAATPGILGLLARAVCEYHRRIAAVHLPAHLRMADFERMGAAVEPAFGWPTGTASRILRSNRMEARLQAIESSVVGILVRERLERDGGISRTPADLLADLRAELLSTRRFPASALPAEPNKFSSELKRIAPTLSALGYTVERKRLSDRKRTRQVLIHRIDSVLIGGVGQAAIHADQVGAGSDAGPVLTLEVANKSVTAGLPHAVESIVAPAANDDRGALQQEVA